MAAILNSAILNLAILDSAILVFPLKIAHTCKIGSHHLHKKTFTHSIWLKLMMAAILNSTMLDSDTAILDSDTFLSSLRFTPKNSHSTLTLTQTNLIWLKLIHSNTTWWWQPSWILPSWIWPSWIQPSQFFLSNSLTLAKIGSHHLQKKPSLIHSDSTWWWQPSWIIPCWIKKTSLIHSDSTWWWQSSWILPCWI